MDIGLRVGAPCFGSDGEKLGTLHRIVIDDRNERVTHLVIDPGLLESGNLLTPGGWEKPRDKVVAIELLQAADDEAIRLTCTKDAFAAMPQYLEEHFTGVGEGWNPPPGYRIEEFLMWTSSAFGLGAAPYVPPVDVLRQEGPTEHEIAEGTPVWRHEPTSEVLGEVVRVLTNPTTQAIDALVVRRGGLLHNDIVLPRRYVSEVQDNLIRVNISDAEWEQLARYTEQ
jgi:uncharacterized protein YrrD